MTWWPQDHKSTTSAGNPIHMQIQIICQSNLSNACFAMCLHKRTGMSFWLLVTPVALVYKYSWWSNILKCCAICIAIVLLQQWRHLWDAVEHLETNFQHTAMDMQWHHPFATTKCNTRVHPCWCSNWFHSKLYNNAVEWLWCVSQHCKTVNICWFLKGLLFIISLVCCFCHFHNIVLTCHHCCCICNHLQTHQQQWVTHYFACHPLFCWPGNACPTLLELIHCSSTILSIVWHHHHPTKAHCAVLHSIIFICNQLATCNHQRNSPTMMSSTSSPMLLWHSRWLHLQPCCNDDVHLDHHHAGLVTCCRLSLPTKLSQKLLHCHLLNRFLHDTSWLNLNQGHSLNKMHHLLIGLCHGHYFCATEGGRKFLLIST